MTLNWPDHGDAIETRGVNRPTATPGRLELVTGPAVEPIDKSDLYLVHKIVTDGNSPETSADDDFLDILIAGARQRAEEVELWRALITQTWRLKLDGFPSDFDAIVLPRPPLQSVDTISYIDTSGDTQTLSTDVYQVYAPTRERGYAALKYGETWPSTRTIADAVTVEFTCGFGDAKADVPEAIRNWMIIRCGQGYELREGFAPQSWVPAKDYVDHLLDPWRFKAVA